MLFLFEFEANGAGRTLVGFINGGTPSGAMLDVQGELSAGLSGDLWLLGGVTVAAVAMDATRYLNVTGNSTTYNLLVGV